MSIVANRSRRGRKVYAVQKPHGVIAPRIQAVGPEHFGIVACDCAKARFKLMLADFYGKVHIPPAEFAVTTPGLRSAVEAVRLALERHQIRDSIVAIERTGEYHRPVAQAMQQAGFEVRFVHPHTTKQMRQPADPGNKTDETDLAAIFRAACNGFGLSDPPLPPAYTEGRMLVRHRRDLVFKTSKLRTQIQEVLHALMPGYAACFDDLWRNANALTIARQTGSPQAVLDAGVTGLSSILTQAKLVGRTTTLEKIVAWARQAPSPQPDSALRRTFLNDYLDDCDAKSLKIQDVERRIARVLVQTPYVLLLVLPGINVVGAADFAFELGPITNVANPNAITGRAGLFPGRYQSDRVDCDGPLVRAGNRRLRAALLQVAFNLNACNNHFRAQAAIRRAADMPAGKIVVKTAKTFSRIAYRIVRERQFLDTHPALQKRHYILKKLTEFHGDHNTPSPEMLADLQHTVAQLPRNAYDRETTTLQEELQAAAKKRGPQPLTEILPIVLAKLGVLAVESTRGTDLV